MRKPSTLRKIRFGIIPLEKYNLKIQLGKYSLENAVVKIMCQYLLNQTIVPFLFINLKNCENYKERKKNEWTFSGSLQHCLGLFALISTTKYLHQRKRRKGIIVNYHRHWQLRNQFSERDSFIMILWILHNVRVKILSLLENFLCWDRNHRK